MARDPKIVPLDIGPTEDESRLRISWKDGVVSEYLPRYLRLLCPCAGCVDEMTGVRTLTPITVDDGVYPTAIHYVGRYAIQCVWSDGHSTGIYTFEYLREIWDREDEPA
jgi:DUF971 family protein